MRYVISFYISDSEHRSWWENGNLNITIVEAESPWRAFVKAVVERQNEEQKIPEERWSFDRAFYELFSADLHGEDSFVYIYASAYNRDAQKIEEVCLPHVQLDRLQQRCAAIKEAMRSVDTIVNPVALTDEDPPALRLAVAHIHVLNDHYKEQLQRLTEEEEHLKHVFRDIDAAGRQEYEHYQLWKSSQAPATKRKGTKPA